MVDNHEDVVGQHDLIARFNIASSGPSEFCPVGWKVEAIEAAVTDRASKVLFMVLFCDFSLIFEA